MGHHRLPEQAYLQGTDDLLQAPRVASVSPYRYDKAEDAEGQWLD